MIFPNSTTISSTSNTVLIDYGCHSFTYRLATHLSDLGFPIRYFANGSLESPNLTSLPGWIQERPRLIRSIICEKPYGKLSLHGRLRGELEWARHCIEALREERPSAVIVSCVPLAAVTQIQRWVKRQAVPLVYWLQDLQGRAIHDLLARKLGPIGRAVGSFADLWEQQILENSSTVITIADGYERELPLAVRESKRYALLENWANVEEFPQFPIANDWSARHGLDRTLNVPLIPVVWHEADLLTFISLAAFFAIDPIVRVVDVSSGHGR